MADNTSKMTMMTRKILGGTFTHLCHFLYFVLITWRMCYHLNEAEKKPSNDPFAVGIFFTVAGVLIQFASICLSTIQRTKIWKWIPGLLFVISSFVQYGITLHFSHLSADTKAVGSTNSTQHKSRLECRTLEAVGDNTTYIILLTTLPMMVITNMAYALTDEDEDEENTLYNAYAALDIIDIAELMFADVGCYQNFGITWLVFFYFALGVSSLLIPFSSYGLEQYSEDGPGNVDFLNTILNVVFIDLLFLILRINTMAQKGKAYFGLIFVIKEFLSFMLRCRMIWKYLRN